MAIAYSSPSLEPSPRPTCFRIPSHTTARPPRQARALIALRHPGPRAWGVYKFIAMNSDKALFGHLLAVQGEAPSTVNVIMSHRLLGTYLDKGEFEAALFSVVQNANEVDDEIKEAPRDFVG